MNCFMSFHFPHSNAKSYVRAMKTSGMVVVVSKSRDFYSLWKRPKSSIKP